MTDLASWLTRLGLGKYADLFAANEIDFDTLPYLTEDDLKEIGLPLGPRRKVLATLLALAPGARTVPSRRSEAERRQLTVMFVDLAGSTALSVRHDPEDMRETISAYQSTVARAISGFEGHVAKFMGDGVLAYFGWPRAHEDEAERAVRASLAVVESVGLLKAPAGEPLVCRIGIATGMVVVGDLAGEGPAQEEAVIGSIPNVAARLQEIAPAGGIVISAQTRLLSGKSFAVVDLGPLHLKGIPEPVRAWLVTGERGVESRFAARAESPQAPLIGREEQLAVLVRRWELAKQDEGQVILLSGEPGIGKSRLVESFLREIDGNRHGRVDFQCSPLHAHSAFYPIIARQERIAGFAVQDPPELRTEKLRKALTNTTNVEDLFTFAALLSLPGGERLSEMEPDPERRRSRIFSVLLRQLEMLSAEQPLICVFEDMHWSDPSTRELVERLVQWIPSRPVLLLVTGRPDFTAPWTGLAHSTLIALNRMSARNAAELITHLAAEKPLPDEVIEQIVQKTDGIPLFVEELTRTVIESVYSVSGEKASRSASALRDLAIPASLHDSLMGRLDRFPGMREVAQVGAVIGRTFDYRLLVEVVGYVEDDLLAALAMLENSALLIRRGDPPEASYSFKHGLIQDTAYSSLLRAKRQRYHCQIAEALLRLSPNIAETDPALLAHHYAHGRMLASAIRYLQVAAERAVEASANAEAINNFAQVLELLEREPESHERVRQEINIRLRLGGVQVQEQSRTTPEIEANYARALELCEQHGSLEERFTALWGLWFVNNQRGDGFRAREFGDTLLPIAEALNDSGLIIEAHHVQWSSQTLRGDFRSALDHAEQGISRYDRERHHWLTFFYGGHDPGSCAQNIRGVALCVLGYPEQAQRHCKDAIDFAQTIGHPYTLFDALSVVLIVDLLTRDLDAIDQHTGMVDELLENRKLLQLAGGVNSGFRGWSLAERGLLEQGLDLMREAQERWHAHYAAWCYPLDASLAALLGRSGHIEEGLRIIDQSLQLAERAGTHWWDSEFYRIRAGLQVLSGSSKRREAEVDLERAIADAQAQHARLFELRATYDLARVRADAGDRQSASELLAPICAWFTEGQDTWSLKEARALLENLAQ